ncbi:MAG TPA: ferrochelatase [Burkholderiaceae bacterium]|nr:ferrochelatase [Burkholderiaceae bacterium]
MARYSSPDGFDHALRPRTAVLLVQLGTPAAPTAAALRPYLRQFLGDPRVVEIPRLVWWPILNGLILNTRPAKSAHKYASVWTEEGSPLMVNSRRQATLLQGALGERGHDVEVALAMRYGEPSIESVLGSLRERNVTRLLVLPMYPQYAGSTTATAIDEIGRVLRGWRNLPELRWIRSFHDDAGYVEALADRVRRAWERDGRAERLVMSFHGVPRRTLELGDPYHCECHVTARLLAERLGLSRDQYVVTFQSRFGKAQWLQPYTEPTLQRLAREGTKSVDVICPGFVADCLETLEEIAMEAKTAFLEAGGRGFRYIGCLNDAPAFVDALAGLVETHTAGWPSRALSAEASVERDRALVQRRARAVELGAAG